MAFEGKQEGYNVQRERAQCWLEWNAKEPPRLQVFCWGVILGKVLTRSNLEEEALTRGIYMYSALCGCVKKEVNHHF